MASFAKDDGGSYGQVAQVDEETATAADGTILVNATPVENDHEDVEYQYQHQQPPATASAVVSFVSIVLYCTVQYICTL